MGAQKDETILQLGFWCHSVVRFVRLDPPELIRSWGLAFVLSPVCSDAFHDGAFDHNTAGCVFPQSNEKFTR
jgi:hypothetical protein